MSGTRLGRGRGGRQAVYGACGVVVVLLIFFYRAAMTEMSRLRELHVQCAHQHEALEAQLQVIYEYKVRLEKSLAEEKNSNAAVKQELQQRATREKSLRDKDSVEAMQRYNSLQQTHKLLQTEHDDLREECEKQRKRESEEIKKLQDSVNEMKTRIREMSEDKKISMEHLKTKYLELETDKTRLEDKYEALVKSNGNSDSTMEHLRKQVIQLERELKDSQHSCKATSPGPSAISSKSEAPGQPIATSEGGQVVAADEQQGNRPSPQQQTSSNGPTSPGKFVPSVKIETSTKSTIYSPSTAFSKPENSVAIGKPVQPIKVKLPSGVLPILNVEPNAKPDDPSKDETVKNIAVKTIEDIKNRPNPQLSGNGIAQAVAPVVAGRKHVGEQIIHRHNDPDWLRLKGIQEIGDDLGNIDKLPEFDDTHLRQGGEGPDYDNMDYYNKGPQQKNNEESEDEGEEEDLLDYPNNDMKKEE